MPLSFQSWTPHVEAWFSVELLIWSLLLCKRLTLSKDSPLGFRYMYPLTSHSILFMPPPSMCYDGSQGPDLMKHSPKVDLQICESCYKSFNNTASLFFLLIPLRKTFWNLYLWPQLRVYNLQPCWKLTLFPGTSEVFTSCVFLRFHWVCYMYFKSTVYITWWGTVLWICFCESLERKIKGCFWETRIFL